MGLHQYPNVCVKLSGQYAFSKEPFPYADLAGWHSPLLRAFGADRLMWATDSPWILEEPGYDNLTRVIDTQLPDLNEKDRALIMGGTAQARLFDRS
jgi:predicted TIM-barrel fold metal-dependent hydrolase